MTGIKSSQYLRHLKLIRDKVPSFDSYPFSIPAVHNMGTIDFHPNVTFIIGENGCGKSTLLEAIAIAYGFNPEGGSRNFRFSTRSSHSSMYKYIRLTKGYRIGQYCGFTWLTNLTGLIPLRVPIGLDNTLLRGPFGLNSLCLLPQIIDVVIGHISPRIGFQIQIAVAVIGHRGVSGQAIGCARAGHTG
ncbi:MAG: hypothetical protein CML06_15375 [Pseudomonadales bacterium]|nr:hypothetical protein [Pseudomonadales bacterium]